MKTIYWLLLLIVLGGCKERYNAPYHLPATGNLVVEGFINTGNGPTNITLTRASSLDSPAIIPQTGAQVSVETQAGASFPLTDLGSGNYSISQVPVDLTQQYRLRIITPDGKQYLSDFAAAKTTPPIDSINWKPGDSSINIYISTHDPQNNTRYYQWKYEETWQYTSAYQDGFNYENGTIVSRPDSDEIFTCWKSDTSSDISIGTSAALGSDDIYEFPLTQVSYASSNKLFMKYSILVKQYALTEDWYNWDVKIRKNTEQVGSIFDAQPSEIEGNMHCISNPGELVIGFIGCTTETEQRIFINRNQIPNTQPIFSGYESCTLDSVKNDPGHLETAFGYGGGQIPVSPVYVGAALLWWLGAANYCVDCRLMGGVLTKPPFWQ